MLRYLAGVLFLRRFLVLITLLLGIGMGIIVGVRRTVIARAETPPHLAVLLPDSTCKPPCWNGIRPGVISLKDINTQLAADSAWTKDMGEGWIYTGETAHQLLPGADNLTFEVDGITLGEWLAVMGEPDFQTTSFVIVGRSYEQVRQLSIYYLDEQLEVTIQFDAAQRLSPYMPLSFVYYTAFATPFYREPWRGFIRLSPVPEFGFSP